MHLYGTAAINGQGHLSVGGCDTTELAREFGTPLYVMDEALLRKNCRAYMEAFRQHYPADFDVAFAGKAFMCMAMAALADQEGLSLDVVSGGEFLTALQAGVPAAAMHLHGNNKTPAELELTIGAGIGQIVVDSLDELSLVDAVAAKSGRRQAILLRITPGISTHGHHYISTGQLDSKFGLAIDTGLAMAAVRRALELRNLELVGLHCHIGSQVFDLTGTGLAAEKMMDFAASVRKETGWTLRELNMGGGLGVRYTDEDTPTTQDAMARMLSSAVQKKAAEHDLPLPKLSIEPGRSIVGEAGTTLYTIGTIKEVAGVRTFVSVDGGMNDNPRPALYQAKYDVALANKVQQPATQKVSFAGRACESGDMLFWDVMVPKVAPGDILAVFTTGAYNYAMASHYNRVPKPAVVFVADGKAELVVRRETFQDMLAFDLLPERLRGR